MKLLAEISEGSLGLSNEFERLDEEYRLRKSARAILINHDGLVATQYLKNYSYHKLPGGGIDTGETTEEALKREVKEEVGCDCEIMSPVGIVIEYRNKAKLLQISYCYVAKVVGEIGENALEVNEVVAGQETNWVESEKLIQIMREEMPKEQEGHFILKREITFLEEYLK